MFLKTTTLVLLSFVLSCNTTKQSVETTNAQDTEATTMDKDDLKEGYTMGTITYHKDSKCTYIITVEKSGIKFDPINIDMEAYNPFKVDGANIYFKYRPLRMKNRCTEAQPIALEAIKKREAE